MDIGLIGCGKVAHSHMKAYKVIENANLVALSDIDLKKAKAFANNYGVRKVFADYADLLEIKDLDFIDICTPVSTHLRIVCDVAKFGHNIFLEKPMALSTSECEEMIRESEKHGSKFCVCHNQIFLPSIKQAKSMVDSGYFNLTSFRTSIKESFELLAGPSWKITPKEKGILWEVGCHAAYLQLHFLQNITEVYAVGGKVKYPVYDDFTVLLRTPNQRYGIVEVSWLATEKEVAYEINSSDGKRARIDRDFDYLLEKSEKPAKHLWSAIYSDEKRILRKWMKFGLMLINKRKILPGYSHFFILRSYVESLRNDLPTPVQPEEAKNTIRLLEGIEESLNTHKVVSIK